MGAFTPKTVALLLQLLSTLLLLLLSLAAAVAERQVGAGLSCSRWPADSCKGAAWILPAASPKAALDRDKYDPPRNPLLEETLQIAGEAVAGLASAGDSAAPPSPSATPPAPSVAPPAPSVAPVQPPVDATASPRWLAATIARLMAMPSGFNGVLSTTVRAVTLTAPATAVAEGARGVPVGEYEARVEYTCLLVERYPTTSDAKTRRNRIGSMYVDGSVLPWGATVVISNADGDDGSRGFGDRIVGSDVSVGFDSRTHVLLPVDGSQPDTPLVACGSALIDAASVPTSTQVGQNPTAASWALKDQCESDMETVVPGAARTRCSRDARGGSPVTRVSLDGRNVTGGATAIAGKQAAALLEKAAVRVGSPPLASAADTRLLVWTVHDAAGAGSGLRAAATTTTAREVLNAQQVAELPRLEPQWQLYVLTLAPAVASAVLAATNAWGVLVTGSDALLRRHGTAADGLRRRVFVIEVGAAAFAVGASAVLGREFGGATARGYVAVEEGVLLGVATAGATGEVLRITVVPVVEGVLVRVGDATGQPVVWAALVLGCVDLLWDAVYVGLSVAVGLRGSRCGRACACTRNAESEEEATPPAW